MIASDTEILHFLQVYKVRNLTRSAKDLNVTQPALTQSLLRLENKLQTTLFIRTKKGCVPTPSADILFEKATLLQEYWEQIRTGLQEEKVKLQGTFRLGCHPSMGAYLLPQFFKSLSLKAEEINIVLRHDFSRKLTDKVIQLELDLAFVVNPLRHPDLVIQKLGTDRIGFWKSQKHKHIPKFIFTDMSDSEMKRVFRAKMKKFTEYKIVETNSLELIRTLVNQGAGYGILPERVATIDSQIVILDEFPTLKDEICLVYRADALKSRAAKTVIEIARNCGS